MARPLYLKDLDYSVVQQCMHCGMCLPTCPTYDATKNERNSPRGRIALMRAIADDKLEVTQEFGDELYFCLGCLACMTSCPAGVDYAELFEMARADIEQAGVLNTPKRSFIRTATIRVLFSRPRLLRLVGKAMFLYQATGVEWIVRNLGLLRLLPQNLRLLEPLTPRAKWRHSDQLIHPLEQPRERRYRVGMLTGCVQDIVFPDVNRDTVDVLLENGCEVVTPREQNCCGSLHAHNGEWELAKVIARRNLDAFDLDNLDVIVTNAAGCGSHLKHYDRLLAEDPQYAARAKLWSEKLRDIHEWLSEIGFRKPAAAGNEPQEVTYHEACHLCHGQKITRQPREVLEAIPGLLLKELPESTWCCGSAGVYNITQPEMSKKLLDRKMGHIKSTGAGVIATANTGCIIQLEAGVRDHHEKNRVVHPVSLLARAYRQEAKE